LGKQEAVDLINTIIDFLEIIGSVMLFFAIVALYHIKARFAEDFRSEWYTFEKILGGKRLHVNLIRTLHTGFIVLAGSTLGLTFIFWMSKGIDRLIEMPVVSGVAYESIFLIGIVVVVINLQIVLRNNRSHLALGLLLSAVICGTFLLKAYVFRTSPLLLTVMGPMLLIVLIDDLSHFLPMMYHRSNNIRV